MDLDEKMHLAIARQQEGNLQEAADIFQDILSSNPDHPDALHYFGVLLHHGGQSDKAISLIEKSLSINPKQPAALNNLGNMYRLHDRQENAEQAYWAAIRFDSGHADSWRNLADIQRQKEDPVAAIKSLKIALTFDPDNFSARHWLGMLLAGMGAFEDAADVFLASVRDDAYSPGNVIIYADLLSHYGKPDLALELVQEWQKKDPDNALAAHHVEAHSGAVSERASDHYVREVFDNFADSFETTLKGLDYDAPATISALVKQIHSDKRIGCVVDLGCGTGLLGDLLKPDVDRLVGVDLSPKMLDHARQKMVYDSIFESEIAAFLQSGNEAPFDLITAAEVMNYIGDVQPVIDAAADTLKPGGLFIGTFEVLDGGSGTGFKLLSNGRYAHQETYLKTVWEAAGLDHVETRRIPLRKNFDEPVEGFLITLRKPA